MLVNSKQATEYVTMAMKAKLVSMIHGDPGIGKSDIVKAIAKQFKLFLIDIRLSQCDPTDLNGFPYFKPGDKRATYVPLDMFPLTDTPTDSLSGEFDIDLEEDENDPKKT